MDTNTDPVRALIDLRDRVLPAAIRYQSVGPGYIEEAQRIVEAALAQQPAGVDGGLTDEAIERALDAPLGLDHTLRGLIRGDTVPVGYSKVDVVRELLRALAAQQQG
jgi:hypothetical protein